MAKRLTPNKVEKFLDSVALSGKSYSTEELMDLAEQFLSSFPVPRKNAKTKKVKMRRGIGSY